MNEINNLINNFKSKNDTPLIRIWINYLLIKKNDIENIINQANAVLNIIDNNNNNINNNLSYDNIITLYNINNFNNT